MRLSSGGRCQAGYVLLELVLVMLIAGLLASWGIHAWVNRYNDAQAHAAAVWMSAVHKGVLAYVQRYSAEIQQATTPDALHTEGFADWRAPRLDELEQAGLLSSATPRESGLIGAAGLRVWRSGDCPGEHCRVEALVFGRRALADAGSGQPDEAMVAQWLLAAQGQGGAVHPGDPGRIRGASFAFSSALPDGTILLPGTVGMAVTADHSALWHFLRLRDVRNPDFQGAMSVAGDVQAGGDIETSGELVVGAQRIHSEPCITENAVAHDVAGGLLVCRSGRWRPASRMGGGGYSINSIHGCRSADGVPTANPITTLCSCPSYAAPVLIMDTGNRPFPEGRQQAYLCVG